MSKIFGKKTYLVTFKYHIKRKSTERETVTVSDILKWWDYLPRDEYQYTVIFAIAI